MDRSDVKTAGACAGVRGRPSSRRALESDSGGRAADRHQSATNSANGFARAMRRRCFCSIPRPSLRCLPTPSCARGDASRWHLSSGTSASRRRLRVRRRPSTPASSSRSTWTRRSADQKRTIALALGLLFAGSVLWGATRCGSRGTFRCRTTRSRARARRCSSSSASPSRQVVRLRDTRRGGARRPRRELLRSPSSRRFGAKEGGEKQRLPDRLNSVIFAARRANA